MLFSVTNEVFTINLNDQYVTYYCLVIDVYCNEIVVARLAHSPIDFHNKGWKIIHSFVVSKEREVIT